MRDNLTFAKILLLLGLLSGPGYGVSSPCPQELIFHRPPVTEAVSPIDKWAEIERRIESLRAQFNISEAVDRRSPGDRV